MAYTNTLYYFLNDDVTAYILQKSAGKALEWLWLINPSAFVGLFNDYYIKLYDPLVQHIFHYWTPILCINEYSWIHGVQHRTCHFGKIVGTYILKAAIQWSMGWTKSKTVNKFN